MNAVSFINNFKLSNEALKMYSFSGETRFKLALDLTLKMEELELKNRELAILEEKTRQEIELKNLEARNKYENASVELIKNLVQAQSMIKSVWDNANINKCNALVGLFNVVMNAQNTTALSGWQSYFKEIKNSIFAIGQDRDGNGNSNSLIDEFKPLMDRVKQSLDELAYANASVKQVSILAPKLELVKDEAMILRGVSIFAKNESGFIFNGKTYQTNTFLFKSNEVGEFEISFYSLNDKNIKISHSIKIKVIDNVINIKE
ncbi:hypothetical protein [Campylobacter sp. VTCC 70190]|uniref:hypothetical protein n=1 Tax=Campylobacter sp. VTCC 70190 TaxID=3392118 RepID=UPI00398E5F5E